MEKKDGEPAGSSAGWSIMSGIDWGCIDVAAAKSQPESLMLVRRAALSAARRTVELGYLLGALTRDAVASALLAREIHDSWKHFHALRSYLEIAEYSPPISESELDQHRRAAPDSGARSADDAAARIADLLKEAARDCAVFSLIEARAPDPALAKLARRISDDRRRHSLGLTRHLAARRGALNEKTA